MSNILAKYGLGTSQVNTERSERERLIQNWSTVGQETRDVNKTIVQESVHGGKYEQTIVEKEIVKEGHNMLAGLKGYTLENMALLYENQAKSLLNETDSNSSGSFQSVAFPMVRRIYGKLLANDIVSVQAMSRPSGDLFYFYPQISERISGTDGDGNPTMGHASSYAKFLASCVGHNCADATFESCISLYDAFYNEDLYDHSKGKYTVITATGATVELGSDRCWTNSAPALATDGTFREVKMAISGFDGANPGTSKGHNARLRGGRGLEVDTQEFLSSLKVINAGAPILDADGKVIYASGAEVLYRMVGQAYGKALVDYDNLCDANGNVYVALDLRHEQTCADGCGTYDGFVGAASGTTFPADQFAFVWRKYDDLEYETEMGEVSFTIKKITVSVTDRRLRARWSPQLAQDVNAYHSIDAEAELTALLSEQVAMEIDREILRDLKNGAAWSLRWDYYGWKNQGSQKYTEKEWKQTLITRINQISAQIHKSTLRGGANFIVVSPEVSAIFDDLETFMVSNASAEEDTYNLGMRKMGTLSGRYTVYVDPYARPEIVLIGHKGTSILDTGYVYAPYIPLQLTPVIIEPNSMTNIKGILTRYAKAMVNSRFYGKIIISRLPTFDVRELR